MEFKPDFNPSSQETDHDFLFIVCKGKLLVKQNNETCSILRMQEIKQINDHLVNKQYFGILDKTSCYCAEWPEKLAVPNDVAFKDIRELFLLFNRGQLIAAGCAVQLIRWNRIHRYCGQCGHLLEDKKDERAKKCPQCNLITYPRLSPAIIVAVTKNNQLLLARSGRFPIAFYSVLAGFVESGETLEMCVAREVYEEVGITIKNIRYFDSQPWPFPDSLMIGFTAEFAGGEIRIDQSEIMDAGWYSVEDFPTIPPSVSIARQLIDWFVENHGNIRTAND